MSETNKDSFRSFQHQLHIFSRKIVPEKRVVLVKKLGMEIYKRLTLKSPVKTGRFRANWGINFETPFVDIDETLRRKDWKWRNALNVSKINSFSEANTQIWICNNMPYANRLEYGWSQQAPNGMVSITLLEMEDWINSRKW